MSINKVILVGNVGKDPEVRYLDKGVAVARFPLATSESYKGKDGERVTATEWHNIVVWRGLAETVEKFVKKGSQLYIEGKIRNRSYDDKDGIKRYVTEIVADQMQMLGKRSDSATDESQNRQYDKSRSTPDNQSGGSYNEKQSSGTPDTENNTQNISENNAFDVSSSSDDDDLPF